MDDAAQLFVANCWLCSGRVRSIAMIFTPHGCCGLNRLSPVLCCFADIDRPTDIPIYLSSHIHPTIHPSIYPFYSASKLNEMEGNVLNAGVDDDGGRGYAHYAQSQLLLGFSACCLLLRMLIGNVQQKTSGFAGLLQRSFSFSWIFQVVLIYLVLNDFGLW